MRPDEKHTGFDFYLLAIALSLSVCTKLHWGPQTVDDAYITLRYAANLLVGHGFVYNAGDPVLGTTSPLYTLLIWMAAAVSGEKDLPFLAFAINIAVDTLNVVLLRALAFELGATRYTAALVAVAYALSASIVYYGCGGMETVVFIFWLLGAFNAYLRKWSVCAFVCAGLAAVTRPEGLALIVVLTVIDILLDRRFPRAVSAGLLPLAVSTVFACWYLDSAFGVGEDVPDL
jgi:hypothetical protein